MLSHHISCLFSLPGLRERDLLLDFHGDFDLDRDKELDSLLDTVSERGRDQDRLRDRFHGDLERDLENDFRFTGNLSLDRERAHGDREQLLDLEKDRVRRGLRRPPILLDRRERRSPSKRPPRPLGRS